MIRFKSVAVRGAVSCTAYVVMVACSSSGNPSVGSTAGSSGVAGSTTSGGRSSADGGNNQAGNGATIGGEAGTAALGGGSASAGTGSSGSGGAAGGAGGQTSGSGGAGGGAGGSTEGGADVGGAPPAFTGPTTAGTVTVTRTSSVGHLGSAFVGFSFEKTHLTDRFFTGSNAALIALFKLLGPGNLRIGANDVDYSSWVPSATPVAGGKTSNNIGTVEVDALNDFLAATGWTVIYGVNLKSASDSASSAAEAKYVQAKLGSRLNSIEIGNEISYYTAISSWETREASIHAAAPGVALAGPANNGSISTFAVPFAQQEASKNLVVLTQHYYKGAASSNPTIAQMLTIDPTVAKDSQTLAAAANSNHLSGGTRWGEMNSYSGHGAAGVSDVFASALWSIDFMLASAQAGSAGVNFHGGGQNMDGNTCSNGVNSCTKPFRYSPIIEVDSQVTAAAPLFYGMLFVAQLGEGDMFATQSSAGNLNFSSYAIKLADGSSNIVLINKDANNGVRATVDTGTSVSSATGTYLQAPALNSRTGVTFAGSGISATGVWNPKAPYTLPTSGNTVMVTVPPGTALLVHAR